MQFQIAIRVNFTLEGHCLWIPTEQYQKITSKPPVQRGQKSFAYEVPSQYCHGPGAGQVHVSIQAAFIRPEWTLIFIDHNVMITFHVMLLRNVPDAGALKPGSQVRWVQT